MQGFLARGGWLRLALTLAALYVFAAQGIVVALARGAQPLAAPPELCAAGDRNTHDQPGSPLSHQDCCLSGGRHHAGAPASGLAPAAPIDVVPARIALRWMPGDAQLSEGRGSAKFLPPARGPPLV